MKILILDKSKFIKQRLRDKLENESTSVTCLNSSAIALKTIIRWHPDVVITGVLVGEINGFDLAMILKLMPDYATIPVIIISSGEKDAVQMQAADVGADHYVPKDNNIIAGVKDAIHKICGDEPETAAVEETDDDVLGHEPGNVLVVDDSAVMRRIIRNMLRSIGIESIDEACNGSEALTVLKENNTGVVLTDWNMPVMNGLDLVKAIRNDPQFHSLPVIMVTTEGGEIQKSQASDAGATDHLIKPFNREKMREMVNRFSRNIICNQ